MVQLTVLNSMAGREFDQALDNQARWGIRVLDLKNHIYGRGVAELSAEEAARAADAISRRQMSVYGFSTELFNDDIEQGETAFKARCLPQLERIMAAASILRPTVIRLLAARSANRSEFADSVDYVRRRHPWLIPLYREAIDALGAAGFRVTIENECRQCLFSRPEEIVSFFRELDRPGKVTFTYDVQNLWEMGTFPTMEVYRTLAPLIGYYHVKGGLKEEGTGTRLAWKSALEDASWPVAEMTQQVVDDGVSEVICLNPSHGAARDGYDYKDLTERDLRFLRKSIRGVE